MSAAVHLDPYSEVELLNHLRLLCLVCRGSAKPFPTAAAPVSAATRQATHKAPLFPTQLPPLLFLPVMVPVVDTERAAVLRRTAFPHDVAGFLGAHGAFVDRLEQCLPA